VFKNKKQLKKNQRKKNKNGIPPAKSQVALMREGLVTVVALIRQPVL